MAGPSGGTRERDSVGFRKDGREMGTQNTSSSNKRIFPEDTKMVTCCQGIVAKLKIRPDWCPLK